MSPENSSDLTPSTQEASPNDPISGRLQWLLGFLCIAYACYHVWQIQTFTLPTGINRTVHVVGAIVLVMLAGSVCRRGFLRVLFLLAVGIALVPGLYIFIEYNALVQQRMFGGNSIDLLVGLLLLASIAVACLLEWGIAVPLLAAVGIAYALFGYLMPGDILFHAGMTLTRLVNTLTIPAFRGTLGSLVVTSAGTIFPFMLFAALLSTTGGIELIIRFANYVGGRTTAGPAQVAVVSSGFMGMISGSSVANVASTGAFTIPMMKRYGFQGEFAGAVEAVASSGGQITPPILGLAAFLIVAITGIPYMEIVAASVAPALIYYAYLLLAVYLRASKYGLTKVDSFDPARARGELVEQFWRSGYALFAIAFLVYLLVIGMPPGTAAIWSIAVIISCELIVGLWRGEDRSHIAGLLAAGRRIVEGFRRGGYSGAQVAIVIAAISVLIEILVMTGFAQKLSFFMLELSGDNLYLLLGICGLSSIMFGLGLPTSAAYVLVALLGAPALETLGVPLLAAHMFVFYLANISSITPPVAVASMVAANIAKADFIRTSMIALRLGLPGFVLPFLFVLHPEMLGIGGTFLDLIWISAQALVIIVIVNVLLENMMVQPLSWADRAGLVVAIILMLMDTGVLTAVGLALVAAVFLKQTLSIRRRVTEP